jgi:hypothetical protein
MLYLSNIRNQFYNNIFIKGGCRREPWFPCKNEINECIIIKY